MKTVYLDNAATSYPKPQSVIDAVTHAATTLGGNPGRASHALSRTVSDAVYTARDTVAAFFGGDPARVVFTVNATEALNLAIFGLIPDHSHVLISDIEHNATFRPINALAKRGVSYDVYRTPRQSGCNKDFVFRSLKEKLRANTAAIVACHRSNILPIEQPLALLGEFAREHNLYLIVDASQSAGALPIHIEKEGISVLCAPSHKGLFGIRGGGFALFSKEIKTETLTPLLFGGSGGDSQSAEMPKELPDRLEAGTLPVEAILSLGAGIDFINQTTLSAIAEKENALSDYLRARLLTIPSLRLYMPHERIGSIALFNLVGKRPHDVARMLDQEGIAIREGLHCAPLAHRLIGTEKSGTLRASIGYFNTKDDVDALVDTLRRISHLR